MKPISPENAAAIIRETIASLGLDLRDRTVLTEAANFPYSVTANIAAAAGARVLAYAADSPWASARVARRDVRSLSRQLNCEKNIAFISSWKKRAGAELVTNSTPLRPFHKKRIACFSEGTCILLMYESWELREGEIDLSACRHQKVHVVGTNEHHKKMNVFDNVGVMAVKILLEKNCPVFHSRIGVLGKGLFATSIAKCLKNMAAQVTEITTQKDARSQTKNQDLLIYADYSNEVLFRWDKIEATLPEPMPCLFFVGLKNQFRFNKIVSLTGTIPPFQHMVDSFSYLGIRPIIELHALSYKAGELFLRGTTSALIQKIV